MLIKRWLPYEDRSERLPAVVVSINDHEYTIQYNVDEAGVTFNQITGNDITSATLRAIRLGELRATIRAHPERTSILAILYRSVEKGDLTADNGALPILEAAYQDAIERIKQAPPKRGRGAKDPDFYRAIAVMYLEHVEQGQRPIQDMTNELRRKRKYRKLSRNTVSTWVRKAREDGWLTRSTQGKAGGEPGPRLEAWYREQEES
jgi:hypothetical protein